MSSSLSSVLGNWRRTSKSLVDYDLEAQIVTGIHAPFTLPTAFEDCHSPAAPTRTPEQNNITTNPIDDFFGVTRTRSTRESRHDSYIPSTRVSAVIYGDAPPAYVDAVQPPAYSFTPAEPVTLAMYLFKFGFLFPPFWVLGAIILLSPLTAPADFEPTKSEAERQELVQNMRHAEIKWAKRSVWAIVIFLIAIGITAGIFVGVLRSR